MGQNLWKWKEIQELLWKKSVIYKIHNIAKMHPNGCIFVLFKFNNYFMQQNKKIPHIQKIQSI